jgi:hypothetical protein
MLHQLKIWSAVATTVLSCTPPPSQTTAIDDNSKVHPAVRHRHASTNACNGEDDPERAHFELTTGSDADGDRDATRQRRVWSAGSDYPFARVCG